MNGEKERKGREKKRGEISQSSKTDRLTGLVLFDSCFKLTNSIEVILMAGLYFLSTTLGG